MRKTLLLSVLALPLVSACGGSSVDDLVSDKGFATCVTVYAVDQMIQAKDSPDLVWTAIGEMERTSEEAANSDPKYDQLALMVRQFKRGLEAGDPESMLDLVALEMECEQLGFGS